MRYEFSDGDSVLCPTCVEEDFVGNGEGETATYRCLACRHTTNLKALVNFKLDCDYGLLMVEGIDPVAGGTDAGPGDFSERPRKRFSKADLRLVVSRRE